MKRGICLAFYLVLVFFASCKNQRNEGAPESVFKITLEAKVNEDDKFQLFYVEDDVNNRYSAERRVTRTIEGKKEFQKIELSLPKGVFPQRFRIDVGENKINTAIEINTIVLSFKREKIVINNLTFERFFEPNIYLEKNKKGYLRKTFKGRYDPFLESTPLLNKRIEIAFKTY